MTFKHQYKLNYQPQQRRSVHQRQAASDSSSTQSRKQRSANERWPVQITCQTRFSSCHGVRAEIKTVKPPLPVLCRGRPGVYTKPDQSMSFKQITLFHFELHVFASRAKKKCCCTLLGFEEVNSNAVLVSPWRRRDGEANNVVPSSFCKGSAGCVWLCVGVWRLCRQMGGRLAHYLAII